MSRAPCVTNVNQKDMKRITINGMNWNGRGVIDHIHLTTMN